MKRYAIHYTITTPDQVLEATSIINAESDAEARLEFFLKTDVVDLANATIKITEVICMGEI